MNAQRRRKPASTPLAHSALRVLITDLLAEYELRHTFRNEGDAAIEAVYSFPVPLDAAFCGMDATLAGETLRAQVLPAKQANRDYDQAISDGDSAVLLEQVAPGMLCVNLGNLKPGEYGEIVLRFCAALSVADGVARFSLPLVHRPRYGRSTLDAVAQPRNDFAVEHPLEAEIRVRGLLTACQVQCATAGASFMQEQDDTVLRIGTALLDRDLVLNFTLGALPAPRTHLVEDGEGSIGVVTFTLPPAPADESARDVCLLLDCSGSMSGDAIAQSRQAVMAVTDALREQDRIHVIRFGSNTNAWFRRPLLAAPRVKDALRQLVETVEADMGGTAMGGALDEALAALSGLDGASQRKVVILVTDGAVTPHEIEKAQERAQKLGIRIFTVAVGSSAGVDVLAPLSAATRGTLERAVPAEPIDAGVMRQFRRARSQPETVRIEWEDDSGNVNAHGYLRARRWDCIEEWEGDSGDINALPLDETYPGDAVTAVARCPESLLRRVAIHLPRTEQTFTLDMGARQPFPAMRHWAGQQAYNHASAQAREEIALRYELITPQTKAVLVKVRAADDKADGLPVVQPVAHMMPEGMVMETVVCMKSAPSADIMMQRKRVAKKKSPPIRDEFHVYELLDIPLFLRGTDRTRSAPPRRTLMRRLKNLLPSRPPRIPSLTQTQKNALAQVLAALLLESTTPLSIEQVVPLIAPKHRKAVTAWLLHHSMPVIQWLRTLLDEGAQLTLDDRQEADLAVLLKQWEWEWYAAHWR